MPSVNDRFPESGFFSAKNWNKSGDLNLQIAYVAYDASCGFDKTADVVHFTNDERTLALNQTTARAIACIHGEEMDEWRGKWITLYLDPGVEYQGKRTGGIRVREVVGNGGGAAVIVPPPSKQPPSKPDFDDEIPF
jgi:hypothetical protein